VISLFGVNGNNALGPGSSLSYGGPFTAGIAFKVTADEQFLLGYYLWRADVSQSASASFALWLITGAVTAAFIPGSSASVTGMTAGMWNFASLGTPLLLSTGVSYKAVYGEPGNFPDTQGQFGGGDVYVNGITSGVLTAFSDVAANGGTNPEPDGSFQGTFGVAGSDPAVNYPSTPDVKSNFWVDVLIGTSTPPPPSAPPAYTAYMASM
jgi:hypothetical protein